MNETDKKFTLTKQAVDAVQNRLEKTKSTGQNLRIFITGNTGQKLGFGMALVKEGDETDFVINNGDVRVIIDPMSFLILEGAILDFDESSNPPHFNIFVPNGATS